MSLPLSILLQISDSAFPTGAFAYSNGLEALARAGKFPVIAALESYLDAYLRQAGEFDLAFLAAAHSETDAVAFEAICLEWDATQWNHAVRRASLRQGRALLDSLTETYGLPGLRDLKRACEATEVNQHFVPVLGRALALLGATPHQACWVHLHGLVRDQAAAAMRLGLLGPKTAQSIQARALAKAEARLQTFAPAGYREVWRTSPLVEAGQGGHGFLYSRLFQN